MREDDTVAVAERVCKGDFVGVGVRVRIAVPVLVRDSAAEGVAGRVGLGDLEGNPERVAVRVVVAELVGMIFTAARRRSEL